MHEYNRSAEQVSQQPVIVTHSSMSVLEHVDAVLCEACMVQSVRTLFSQQSEIMTLLHPEVNALTAIDWHTEIVPHY